MMNLRYNHVARRFDCCKDSKYITTHTCGTRFNLYCYNEDIFVVGRIEYHNLNGYYFIGDDNASVVYLYDGLKGMCE